MKPQKKKSGNKSTIDQIGNKKESPKKAKSKWQCGEESNATTSKTNQKKLLNKKTNICKNQLLNMPKRKLTLKKKSMKIMIKRKNMRGWIK